MITVSGKTILYTDPDLWVTEPITRLVAKTEVIPVRSLIEPRRRYLTVDFLITAMLTFGIAFDVTMTGLCVRLFLAHHHHH